MTKKLELITKEGKKEVYDIVNDRGYKKLVGEGCHDNRFFPFSSLDDIVTIMKESSLRCCLEYKSIKIIEGDTKTDFKESYLG